MAAPFQPTAGGYTVLRCAKPGAFATKMWSWNPTLNQWLLRTYNAGMWFHPTEENTNSLDELFDGIVRNSADPSALFIRGALKPAHREARLGNPKLQVRRNKLKKGDSEPFFDEIERCWVMVDFDNFLLRESDDLVDDPESAVAHAIQELLPPCFHDARCFFQLSASAGFVPGVLKCHVFFWLSAPIADSMLKAIMKQCAPRLSDFSVYQAVQPHYIAAPIIQGGHDPIPYRFGWIDGIDDAVTLPALAKKPKPPNGTVPHVVGRELEDRLASFGDAPGLDGFHTPLLRSTMAYARRCLRYGGRDDVTMKSILTKTIQQAPIAPSRHSVDEYLADAKQQMAIDGAFALLLNGDTDHQPGQKPHFEPASGDIDEGRQALRDLLTAMLKRVHGWHTDKSDAKPPAEQAGIAAVVGMGKSSILRELLLPYIDTMGPAKLPYRVIWLVPTHALGSEALADFEKLGITAAAWKGRDYTDPKDPNAERMCLDIDAVTDAITIGLDIEKYVCGDPKTDQVCPHHGECKFQAQKAAVKRAEVVIAAHQSLFGTLAKVITDKVGLVVIDKSWWKAGLHTARDTFIAGFADAITKYPPLRDANAAAGKRQKNAPKVMVADNKATQQLFEWSTKAQAAFLETNVDDLVSKAHVAATGLTAGNCREAAKLEWHRKVEPNIWPGMPHKMRKDALQAAAVNGSILRRAGIWHALAELLEGTETHTGRLQVGERTEASGPEPTILLHSRREISNQLKDLPMLLLDASLPEQIIKHFLPRFTTMARIDAAAPFMTVTQVIRGWGRTNMVPTHSSKVAPEENRRRENFLAELRDFVALHKTDRGALVITYQAIERHFANIPGVATGHFNALRGIDAHGDVGAVFVIGRPLPDFNELRTMAMALTGLPIPIEEPRKETRGPVMADGSSRSIEVRTYATPNLELLRSAITDAEVIDNVGRARAVNRTSTQDGVSVYLMTDVVTPLPVTTLTNWNNLRLSPVARMAARGCVLQCSADAHKAYPDLFVSPNAAKQAIHTEKERWVSFPYDKLYIRESNPPLQLTPVRYQLAGPGKKPAMAWFTSEMVANGREWLEQRLGTLTFWSPPATQPKVPMMTPHDGEPSADHEIDPANVYPAAGANGHHVPTDVFAIQPDLGSIFVYDDGRAVFRPHHKPGRVVLAAGGPQEPAFVVTGFAPSLLVAAA